MPDDKPVVVKNEVDLGCFGCLLQLIGIGGVLWLINNWDEFWGMVSLKLLGTNKEASQ